jgi:TusA-related sulfurtransferase
LVTVDEQIDCTGLLCPIPVIRLGTFLASAPSGVVVMVVSDDVAAATDIPAMCQLRGHEYLGARPVPDLGDHAVGYLVRAAGQG